MERALKAQEHCDFPQLLAALGTATGPAIGTAVEALSQVRHAVVTGEGPAARGRIHFSRTLDAEDAELCARILTAAGGKSGSPVSRAEADILFDIHESALERQDAGRFDDLFAKAIAHHVLDAAGREVPPRQWALAASTPLEAWAGAADFEKVDREVAEWVAGRVNRSRNVRTALEPVVAMLIGAGAVPLAMSVAGLLDWAG